MARVKIANSRNCEAAYYPTVEDTLESTSNSYFLQTLKLCHGIKRILSITKWDMGVQFGIYPWTGERDFYSHEAGLFTYNGEDKECTSTLVDAVGVYPLAPDQFIALYKEQVDRVSCERVGIPVLGVDCAALGNIDLALRVVKQCAVADEEKCFVLYRQQNSFISIRRIVESVLNLCGVVKDYTDLKKVSLRPLDGDYRCGDGRYYEDRAFSQELGAYINVLRELYLDKKELLANLTIRSLSITGMAGEVLPPLKEMCADNQNLGIPDYCVVKKGVVSFGNFPWRLKNVRQSKTNVRRIYSRCGLCGR